ncbi:MAG TPA: CDP-glucose 4,6-dehydratase [Gammaproteobacteria bacterium]|nr:CDP-glucose 4,6-dehydratase [Gammaproteobacteria bacterium]
MFWKNKKVLVTGHTGFKGSWLTLWLQQLGADVSGFALPPPTNPNLFTLANVASGMQSIMGDLRDFNQVKKAVTETQPEIIIHMAAQPLVRYSYEAPIETYATNVMGTVHLLEACKQTPSVRTIINVTTDKCYENKEWERGYTEDDRLGGHDPYSNSKACAELVTSAFRHSYFYGDSPIALASVRAGNVIGGGDWAADRLIPDIIKACIEKKPVTLRNPDSTRPWQHVLEPLGGYLLLAEKLYSSPKHYAEGWNFGPDEKDAKPVRWITDFIFNLWQHPDTWQQDKNPKPHEAHYLKLDCGKAKEKLNWHPRWTIEKGLTETVSWYKAWQANKNMRDVTLDQIQRFTNYSGDLS